MLKAYSTLLRDERPVLAFCWACTFLSAPGQTFFISLFIAPLSESMGLSAGQLGSIYLGATLGAAALLPWFGHWIDRIDLSQYVAAAMAGLALACAVMASVAGPLSLFAAFLLLRLFGQGLMAHTGLTASARHFADRRGRALSLVVLGFPLSEAVFPPLAVALIGLVGWRAAYLGTGLVILLAALPLLLWLIAGRSGFTRPPLRARGAARPSAWDGARIVGRTAYFWLVMPLLIYMPLSATALIFYVQPIGAAKGWSPEFIAASFSGFAAGHAAAILIGGVLVDLFTARNVLAATGLPMVLGIGLLALFDAPLAAIAYMALVGASTGLAHTVVSAMWAEVYGIERLGTIRSFSVMLMVAGTAVGPAAVGPMIDAGWPVARIAGLFAGLGTLAMLLALTARLRAPLPLSGGSATVSPGFSHLEKCSRRRKMPDDAVSAQLAPYTVDLEEGRNYAWCRCGRSGKQPFCDGSHKETGIEPLLFKAERTETVMLCGCKRTDDEPFCDGSHNLA